MTSRKWKRAWHVYYQWFVEEKDDFCLGVMPFWQFAVCVIWRRFFSNNPDAGPFYVHPSKVQIVEGLE